MRVRLLGGFRLHLSDQVEACLRPRLQALLAYLLLHRQAPLSRTQIAALFWPDGSESQSRTNLRNLLHELRRSLPDFERLLICDQNRLEWRPDAPISADIYEFEDCLKAGPGKGILPGQLEQAADLYSGDLLPDCYEDWIQPIRERLRQAFLSALSALAALREDERDYPAALADVQRLLRADPLHPEANRQQMRLHCLLGDRAAALRSYRAYAQRLKGELGEEPDPETRALYEQVRDGLAGGLPVPEPSPGGAFVGRNAEWRRLQSFWGMVQKGGPQLVMIQGEAGIGKTRLVEEFCEWARRQSIEIASASCYPAEGSLPYAAVTGWLRARPLPALDKTWTAEIARLLPDLDVKIPRPRKPGSSGEAWQRQRLFEALARALLTRRRALIMVLEDVHWCDKDTLEWLHYLLRFDPQATALVVATLRSGEITADHPLTALRAALQAEGKYNELELHPLSQAETLQLASQTLKQASRQELSVEAAAQVFSQSEGNPLFVIEMVRLGLHEPPDGGALAASGRAQAVLGRRVAQLSPAAREVTNLAALIGREFSLDVLQCAGDESEERLVQALDEMLQRHIIREITPQSYDFTHDRLREAAASELSSAHRRLLHRRIAAAYRALDEGAPRPRFAEIASHYDRAGLAEQAIQQYRLASEAAAGIFANADALRLIQRAFELAETSAAAGRRACSPEDFTRILEELGDLLALGGKYTQAQACYERALGQDGAAPAIWRSQVWRKISDGLIPLYRHDQAQAALDQAEEALQWTAGEGPLPELREWLQIQLARIQLFYWDNQPDQMETLIRKIAPALEASGSIDQQITFLSLQCQVRMRRERFRISAETVALARRRIVLAEIHDNPFDLAVARFQFGFTLLWHDDLPGGQDWLLKGYEDTLRLGTRIWQVRSLAYLGVVRRKLGELAAMREDNRKLLDMAEEIQEYTYLGIGLANQGWLAWRDGDASLAEPLCLQALEVWKKHGGGGNVFHWLADWVLLAIAVERRDLSAAGQRALALLDPDPTCQTLDPQARDSLQRAVSACQGVTREAGLALFAQALDAARACREL